MYHVNIPWKLPTLQKEVNLNGLEQKLEEIAEKKKLLVKERNENTISNIEFVNQARILNDEKSKYESVLIEHNSTKDVQQEIKQKENNVYMKEKTKTIIILIICISAIICTSILSYSIYESNRYTTYEGCLIDKYKGILYVPDGTHKYYNTKE